MTEAATVSININLVGFDNIAHDKFSKQLDTINRMNTAQDRLKYPWHIGRNIQTSQVHFVINTELPQYLIDSSDPILTNLNLDHDQAIPCPYPVTTFDLMDILVFIEGMIKPEKLFFNQNNPEPAAKQSGNTHADTHNIRNQDLSLYERAQQAFSQRQENSSHNTPEPSNVDVTNPKNNSDSASEDKPTIKHYGNYKRPVNSEEQNTATHSATTSATASWTHASSSFNQTNNKTLEKKDEADANVPQSQPDSLAHEKNTLANQQSISVDNSTSAIKTPLSSIEQSKINQNLENFTASTTSMDMEAFDPWLQALNQASSMIEFETPHFYLDASKQNICTECKNAHELAQSLFKQKQVLSKNVDSIPSELKTLPLAAVLWSYGLHHPTPDSILNGLDLGSKEWKLKGFPKFGQWETHPTWLFLATFFAQKHRSIYEAQAQGKADAKHIEQFICAAQLAGLTWESKPLDIVKKQEQLALLQERTPTEAPNWISRLRDKLHVNEHFES